MINDIRVPRGRYFTGDDVPAQFGREKAKSYGARNLRRGYSVMKKWMLATSHTFDTPNKPPPPPNWYALVI